MPLIQEDFVVLKPIRTSTGESTNPLAGKINCSAYGGIITDVTPGASFRSALSTELVDSISDPDNYEIWTDNQGDSAAVDYHTFTDFVKAYIVNLGDENLSTPSLTVTGLTSIDEDVTNIYTSYFALGLVDESDYAERGVESVSDNYADDTLEGFPTTEFGTTGLTKVAENIVDAGVGADKLAGAHKLVRAIELDSDLYEERKSVKVTWSSDPTDGGTTNFFVYVFGETNQSYAVGRVLLDDGTAGVDASIETEATIVAASDDSSDITFHQIYGIFCIKQASAPVSGNTFYWNDINSDSLVSPETEMTIKYSVVGETSWSDWVTLQAYTGDVMPFSLTFYDESLLYYGEARRLMFSRHSGGMRQTRIPSTTTSTVIVDEADGDIAIASPDDEHGLVNFDSPDIDISDVKLGDRVLGHTAAGVIYDCGIVAEIETTPDEVLTTSIIPQVTKDNVGDIVSISIVDGTYSRVAFWVKHAAECQPSIPQTTPVTVLWRIS